MQVICLMCVFAFVFLTLNNVHRTHSSQSLIADEISKSLGGAVCTNASSFAVMVNINHNESAEEVKQIPAIKVGKCSHWSSKAQSNEPPPS